MDVSHGCLASTAYFPEHYGGKGGQPRLRVVASLRQPESGSLASPLGPCY
jgi:hypothetical protein